jgi:hypothetical protein
MKRHAPSPKARSLAVIVICLCAFFFAQQMVPPLSADNTNTNGGNTNGNTNDNGNNGNGGDPKDPCPACNDNDDDTTQPEETDCECYCFVRNDPKAEHVVWKCHPGTDNYDDRGYNENVSWWCFCFDGDNGGNTNNSNTGGGTGNGNDSNGGIDDGGTLGNDNSGGGGNGNSNSNDNSGGTGNGNSNSNDNSGGGGNGNSNDNSNGGGNGNSNDNGNGPDPKDDCPICPEPDDDCTATNELEAKALAGIKPNPDSTICERWSSDPAPQLYLGWGLAHVPEGALIVAQYDSATTPHKRSWNDWNIVAGRVNDKDTYISKKRSVKVADNTWQSHEIESAYPSVVEANTTYYITTKYVDDVVTSNGVLAPESKDKDKRGSFRFVATEHVGASCVDNPTTANYTITTYYTPQEESIDANTTEPVLLYNNKIVGVRTGFKAYLNMEGCGRLARDNQCYPGKCLVYRATGTDQVARFMVQDNPMGSGSKRCRPVRLLKYEHMATDQANAIRYGNKAGFIVPPSLYSVCPGGEKCYGFACPSSVDRGGAIKGHRIDYYVGELPVPKSGPGAFVPITWTTPTVVKEFSLQTEDCGN